MLNYIKVNLREIRNTKTGKVERVTLLNIESDMAGYRGLDAASPASSQIYELPYILHALSFADITAPEERGFPYSFPLKF